MLASRSLHKQQRQSLRLQHYNSVGYYITNKNSIAVYKNLRAVSYTHLDVYKRQDQDDPGNDRVIGGIRERRVLSAEPEEK